MFGIVKQCMHQPADGNSNNNRFNYCGTCKSIGSRYGQSSRMFLNYDIVFLSQIMNNFLERVNYSSAYEAKSCFNLPSKKDIPLSFQYTSALNVFLARIKVQDNIVDSKNWQEALKWKTSSKWYNGSFEKAERDLNALGFPMKEVEQLVYENFEAEKRPDQPLSFYVNSTEKITALSFQHAAQLLNLDKDQSDHFYKAGAALGRLVYMMDARDDYRKDIMESNFNPLIVSTAVDVLSLEEQITKAIAQLKEQIKSMQLDSGLLNSLLGKITNLNAKKSKDLEAEAKRIEEEERRLKEAEEAFEKLSESEKKKKLDEYKAQLDRQRKVLEEEKKLLEAQKKKKEDKNGGDGCCACCCDGVCYNTGNDHGGDLGGCSCCCFECSCCNCCECCDCDCDCCDC